MPLETGTFIKDLNANNPAETDAVAQGADHIRLVKSVLQSQFPGLNSADTAVQSTAAQIDALTGAANSTNPGVATAPQLVPVGGILMWCLPAAPANYLFCNGQTVNITDWPALFALLGTTFGGDGTTTFGLPNYSEWTLTGASGMGGIAAAGRFTTVGSGVPTLNVGIGTETHVLSAAEMPAHRHVMEFVDTGHTHADGGHRHGVVFSEPGHTHSFDVGIQGGVANVTGAIAGGGLQTPSYLLIGEGGAVNAENTTWPVSGIAAGTTGGENQAIGHVQSNDGFTNLTDNNVSGLGGNQEAVGRVQSSDGVVNQTNIAGSGGAHTNVQPSIGIGVIMRAA